MTLTIRHLQGWPDDAARLLAPAMSFDPGASVVTLAHLVRSGAAALFGVFLGDELAGAYVVRAEAKEGGYEGVIVAAGSVLGIRSAVSIYDDILPVVERQLSGCATVRVHTARPGMVRMMQRRGFRVREVVMMKKIEGVAE